MVRIVSYDESWPVEFQTIGDHLRETLGDLALRIDHIGSTAVPGLAAKDVIDIQITVAALDEQVLEAMTDLGYTKYKDINRDHLPPGFEGEEKHLEKWVFSPPGSLRPSNIHMRVKDRFNQRYALLFRDYLRAHPNMAQAYAELKRRLAAHLADPQMYPDVKDPAVDLIYLSAEEWAVSISWEPGPSDA